MRLYDLPFELTGSRRSTRRHNRCLLDKRFIQQNQGVGIAGDTTSIGGIGSAGWAVDPMQGAGRVQLRPIDCTQGAGGAVVLGHYRQRTLTSAIAPTGGGVMSNFRFVAAGQANFAALLRVLVETYVVTAVTAQRSDPMLLKVARGYTASESSNNTNLTIAGNAGKMRTSMATSAFATAGQIASTSNTAGMSGGTSTLDANAIGEVPTSGSVGLVGLNTGLGQVEAYSCNVANGEHPLILATNEGVQLLFGTTTLATGTVIIATTYIWAELSQY